MALVLSRQRRRFPRCPARQLKEAYAVRRTVPPSAEIEAGIERMLSVGVGENPRESLSELAGLGARLIIQRAVEDEFDAWLGRARYERRPDEQRGCRTMARGCVMGSCADVADRRGRARGRDPAGPPGGRDVRLKAVCADAEAVADRAFESVGDRRVCQGLVDARCRVVVRAGRAGEAVQVDRVADV
jgi:hypothetical protein